MYYEEYQREKVGLLQFQDIVLDNLSKLVCNQKFIDDNFLFFEHYCFKAYEKYNNSKTEQYSINQVVSLLEIMLDALFKYRPETELPEDIIDIS